MKKVIYTAIIGNYDNVPQPLFRQKGYDYILFTNQQIKSDFWDVRQVLGYGVKIARKIKTRPDLFVNEYDENIWIDANIVQKTDISELLKLDNFDLVTIKHPTRDCIYEEAKACVSINKDTTKSINRQMDFYRKNKYPNYNGMVATGIIARKKNKKVTKLMSLWWEQIEAFSPRDQLSFNYCLQEVAIKMRLIPFSVLFSHFNYHNHK